MEQSTFARRGLLAAVIGMGLLIIVGTGTLLAVIAHRMSHHARALPPVSLQPVAEKTIVLHEPAGTIIGQISWQNGSVLAVRLTGGGPDRIVLWDTAGRRIVGRLELAP
ncbi:hypothetical protein [Acetobacter fallax]|uniref:Uncharacterized protein n=1 Tax=Acetobacter fallax TaxID=1737473 RepID=A0ABX0KEX6_9PROT|nr:hypothetical protein [Acetobacter fallax]NHO34358.1 hypothetical protein [Acetobacter fallax]NHO37927.1 hypothetical protein [Acetobacter fallax]